MRKKGPSRGRKRDPEAQKRTKFTTKLNKRLLRELKRLAAKEDKSVNELIEEAVRKNYQLD